MPLEPPPDDAYERLIAPSETKLAAAAWRLMRCQSDAADVLQDAIVKIWNARETLTDHACREAWMLRIVLNTAFEHLRRRPAAGNETFNVECSVSRDDETTSELSLSETKDRVLNELTSLSPQQAEAVLLRLVEGLPYDEVASALDCTVATARVHVNRGREKLRERLRDLDPNQEGAII